MDQYTLITGATGNTGRVIAERLKQRNISFKVMARSEMRRRELESAGFSVVMGDFDDASSLDNALMGVQKAYLVCTPDERLVPRETAFINAAKKAGVQHIIKCSAYLADVNAKSLNLRSHGIIENALMNSGLTYTIIRPHGYMQTFLLFSWDTIQKAGVISLPGGDGKMALVDMRDVAEVAVKALTESGHEGKIYDITGAQALDFHEQAEILTRFLDRPVTYIPSDERQLKMVMSVFGVPETPTQHVVEIFRMQRQRGIEKVHSTLQDLGIQPIKYEQFVKDWIAGRTGGGNSFQPPDTLSVKLMNATMPFILRIRLYFHNRAGRKQ